MELEKKDVIIIFLSFCLLFTSVVSIFLLISPYGPPFGPVPPRGEALIIGTGSGPHDLDPTDCWDSASNDVIEQVVETLFTYDTRQFVVDETMPRVNWLATGYSWSGGNTILTVDIRTGVRFHDGTPMDAAAVAWSFNRFMFLMNHTGGLPPDGRLVKVHSLYEFPDGTPIFQSVVAADVDTVIFTLTAPYAPILDAMCYISCGILSPVSTPATSIIDLTGDIVGTGPYMYDYYITDTEVRFTKFEDYWGAGVVENEVMFDLMIYSVIDDPSALNYLMLAGDIDILFGAMTDLIPTFEANPWINVYKATKPGLVYQYLAFNTKVINVTWRKAMSYAINYTYIIEDMLEGRAFRSYGAISSGYGAAFNSSLTNSNGGSAYYNLTIARQTILDGLGSDSKLDPRIQANDTLDDPLWLQADLATFNYSYNYDNWLRTDLYPVLADWFDDIGITFEDGSSPWWWFILRAYGYVPGGYDDIEVYFIGWAPDHLDPFNMLYPLFFNTSFSNACQVNDPQIMQWFSDALLETNQTLRFEIYHKIQSRIYTQIYCHAPIYHNQIVSVHAADLKDMAYNVMGRWWALPVKRNWTWVPEL
ncbi:MAG: ABC transporter substrate-binding protein [Promethearchaeota archaeon]